MIKFENRHYIQYISRFFETSKNTRQFEKSAERQRGRQKADQMVHFGTEPATGTANHLANVQKLVHTVRFAQQVLGETSDKFEVVLAEPADRLTRLEVLFQQVLVKTVRARAGGDGATQLVEFALFRVQVHGAETVVLLATYSTPNRKYNEQITYER